MYVHGRDQSNESTSARLTALCSRAQEVVQGLEGSASQELSALIAEIATIGLLVVQESRTVPPGWTIAMERAGVSVIAPGCDPGALLDICNNGSLERRLLYSLACALAAPSSADGDVEAPPGRAHAP